MRPRILSLIVLPVALIAGSAALAQSRTPDALDRRFETLRADLLADPDRGLVEARTLERAARRARGDAAELVASAQWLQAEAYVRLGDAPRARERVASALRILNAVRPAPAMLGNVLRTRGDLATDAADVGGALTDYQAAFRASLNVGDRRGQTLALMSIASLYRQGADFQTALRYYDQAIDSYDADPLLVMSLFNNRGNVLTEMKLYARARADFERALVLVRRTDNRAFEAVIWGNLARAQVAQRDLDAAARSIDAGIAIGQRANPRVVRDSLQSLAARIAVDRGQRQRAARLIAGVFVGTDLTRTTLGARDNHRNAYAVYAALGDRSAALAHLEALERLDEQATQITTTAKTALMAARFDFQNQELRIARLRQEELRRNVEMERATAQFQRTLFGSIAAAVAVLIALLTFGVIRLRRSRNAVRDVNIALQKALKAKADFLATTSHEIRTPLNGILGMTQVMLVDPHMAPAMRDRLDIVHDAGMAMRALVDDILDIAKMEVGNLDVERIATDLPRTIEAATRVWRRQAEDRGLAFRLDTGAAPHWIDSDPARLRQIVSNLLSNALKFTERGEIGVAVAVAGDRLRIAVRDTGIGIAADRIDDVFDAFQQADTSTTRRFGGTGLGLTICRNLARALGGDILIDSVVGVGSTFTLDVPLTLATAPDGADAACDDADAGALIVLERNPITRSMMRTLFAPHVAAVEFVDDAAMLLARLGRGGAAAVLVDAATVHGTAELPPVAFARIAAAVAAAGIAGVVVVPNDDRGRTEANGMTLLAKPVSGTKLIDILFCRTEGSRTLPAALVINAR